MRRSGCSQTLNGITAVSTRMMELPPDVAVPSVNWRDAENLHRWPSNSPDLNPIENLWSFFQDAVAAHEPKTLDEFEVLLDKVWWGIPQDHIRNLYHSMPTRLRTVLAADGQMTKY